MLHCYITIVGSSSELCRHKKGGTFQYEYHPRYFYTCVGGWNAGCQPCATADLRYNAHCKQCLSKLQGKLFSYTVMGIIKDYVKHYMMHPFI